MIQGNQQSLRAFRQFRDRQTDLFWYSKGSNRLPKRSYNQLQSNKFNLSWGLPAIFLIEDKKIKTKKILAQGGYGFVYLVQDLHTKKKYALKVVGLPQNEARMTFQKEVEVMRLLGDHPNLVKMHSAEQKQEYGFILMERARMTLWEYIYSTMMNPMPEEQIVFVLREVSSGLRYLHSKGLAHRDIKAENILLMNDGSVCICDFGSCTNDFMNSREIPREQYGKYTTGLYKPPELVDLELGYRIDQKMDMWMLGCLAYVMCFYQAPFKGQKQQIKAAQVRIPFKGRVSKQLQELILKLLKPNPKERPTASETLKYLNSMSCMKSTSAGSSK